MVHVLISYLYIFRFQHAEFLKIIEKFLEVEENLLSPPTKASIEKLKSFIGKNPPIFMSYSHIKISLSLAINLILFVSSYGVIIGQVISQKAWLTVDFERILKWIDDISKDGCVSTCF